jgi:hypothetical protein
MATVANRVGSRGLCFRLGSIRVLAQMHDYEGLTVPRVYDDWLNSYAEQGGQPSCSCWLLSHFPAIAVYPSILLIPAPRLPAVLLLLTLLLCC